MKKLLSITKRQRFENSTKLTGLQRHRGGRRESAFRTSTDFDWNTWGAVPTDCKQTERESFDITAQRASSREENILVGNHVFLDRSERSDILVALDRITEDQRWLNFRNDWNAADDIATIKMESSIKKKTNLLSHPSSSLHQSLFWPRRRQNPSRGV